jgi:hypothetical protein
MTRTEPVTGSPAYNLKRLKTKARRFKQGMEKARSQPTVKAVLLEEKEKWAKAVKENIKKNPAYKTHAGLKLENKALKKELHSSRCALRRQTLAVKPRGTLLSRRMADNEQLKELLHEAEAKNEAMDGELRKSRAEAARANLFRTRVLSKVPSKTVAWLSKLAATPPRKSCDAGWGGGQ